MEIRHTKITEKLQNLKRVKSARKSEETTMFDLLLFDLLLTI